LINYVEPFLGNGASSFFKDMPCTGNPIENGISLLVVLILIRIKFGVLSKTNRCGLNIIGVEC